MFAGTPYEHDALGTRPSFEKTTAAMLKSFHDTWYAPNNAILVIAGDVDPAGGAHAWCGSSSATSPPGSCRRSRRCACGPCSRPRSRVDTDHPNGTLMIATRTPGPQDEDFAALEVLADVLSSRRFDLYGLVPQGKAIAAEFALDPLPQAGLAYAALSFTTGEDPRALEREVRAILARVATRRAFRPSWWRPPSCRSAVPHSFSATPSPSSPRSGRMRSRCTVSALRTRTWRASSR